MVFEIDLSSNQMERLENGENILLRGIDGDTVYLIVGDTDDDGYNVGLIVDRYTVHSLKAGNSAEWTVTPNERYRLTGGEN